MIELLFVCLIIWMLYSWKTGKFSKENQEKNRAEFRKDWLKLKQDFKKAFTNSKSLEEDKLKLQAKKDYGYTLRILGKSKTNSSSDNNYKFSESIDEPDFEILYSSYNNPASYRKIKIIDLYNKKYDGEYYTYIDAYCFSAEDERTFRLDRIEQVKELSSGKIFFSQHEIEKIFKRNC
ncbi:WYL domain-containing protein [Acinetobacter baumannii]|uniref:WYL domain-containing protein n=1 Tax=Acinetobacter baumannii TaxID=470 RepID=UPI000A3540A9|nr:WYL domain-containing protein [Acinetobacter baumannii]